MTSQLPVSGCVTSQLPVSVLQLCDVTPDGAISGTCDVTNRLGHTRERISSLDSMLIQVVLIPRAIGETSLGSKKPSQARSVHNLCRYGSVNLMTLHGINTGSVELLLTANQQSMQIGTQTAETLTTELRSALLNELAYRIN